MTISPRLRKGAILLAVILIVIFSLIFGLRKTVTLTVNGQSQTIETYAFTVGNLLHNRDIPLSPLDALFPSQNTWLKNGDQITVIRAIPIQIYAYGQLRYLYSADRTPSSLFTQAGINVLPGDQVLSNGLIIDPSQPFHEDVKSLSLQLIPAVNYTINDNGKTIALASTASTLGSALWAAGYTLFDADQLTPSLYTPLTPDLPSDLKRSQQVIVHTKDKDVITRTSAITVGEALEDANLSIQGLDYSIPPAEDAIPANGEIDLVHVIEDVLVEQTPLPFETQYQPVPDLEIDKQSIIQTGEYGLSAKRVQVRYEDGQEVSRQVEGQWEARQPKPRIVGFGTSVIMHTTVVDGVSIQYWRVLDMYATSYHPSVVGGTTASGLPLKKGVAAVDTSLIPFYTQMYVPGYGEVVAADIGGGVVGRMIDLGYSDDDYVAWHQSVKVYFLWPPPDNIVWILP
jgi:resuscitation-promoting factor RpfB